MFSLLGKLHGYFFNNDTSNEETTENFLAEELLQIEAEISNDNNFVEPSNDPVIPSTDCFERTGTVTFIAENYGLIDGMLYFDYECSEHSVTLNQKVRYLGYREKSNGVIKIVRILQNLGQSWNNEEDFDEEPFKVLEHSLIGEVDYRNGRTVKVKASDVKFSLDDVQSTFVPIQGDWLEMLCKVRWDDTKVTVINTSQVLEVISVRPLRSKVINVKIYKWSGEEGLCERQIYFNKHSLVNGYQPQIGAKVIVEAIESNQGSCTWRAIKLIPDDDFCDKDKSIQILKEEEQSSLDLEREKGLKVTHPLQFMNVNFNTTTSIQLEIFNGSPNVYSLHKWKLLNSRQDSQLQISPVVKFKKLLPNQSINLVITCHPKTLGRSREMLVLEFDGFQIKRQIDMIFVNDDSAYHETASPNNNRNKHIQSMREVLRKSAQSVVPGVKLVKTPAFIPVRLAMYPIPDKVWCAILGDNNDNNHTYDFNKILSRIESTIPCLCSTLHIANYTERWHNLLFMEEIQQNLHMRSYDVPKAFLTHIQEYLSLEVKGLSERRPSLIAGDSAVVRDIWNPDKPSYEGFIHAIRGDLVLMKFNYQFHEIYSGYDVSIEFHFSRTVYRKCHQGINLALNHLGPDILFPNRIKIKEPKGSISSIQDIKWNNVNLNDGQKQAVYNIVLGVGRPLPYVIFGPPGTGKTITVVETILQILSTQPESRILVATPSNSAANLLTERLIEYKETFSSSIIRLIAYHVLESDTLPEVIKPFCATLDLAKEKTAKDVQFTGANGVTVGCRSSYVGRHRVTIGTCSSVGTLALMELPKGHFTHVIVDEAGQATEPEIMIPLTFIDKDSGQIILAGDPMQLGPVTVSKYAGAFGLGESYLSRILETFPYQADVEAFKKSGFDNRLITRLTDNYRSLKEVLTIPSQLFYDGSLVPKVSKDELWIATLLSDICDILPNKSETGGLFVWGIQGINMKAEDSPSWYNPQEASMVLLYACKLYKRNVKPDQIGIITPYIAQIRYLRKLFDSTGSPQPKIGTVEEFQGQEKPVIIISTVRSTENLLEDDLKHTLGFVRNPKRLNVALTRAQIATVLFCNPHLLCRDTLWNKVISHAVDNNKYTGCNLPTNLNV